jgi:hypothetical protein
MQYRMIDLNTPIETIESFEVPAEWWAKANGNRELWADLHVIQTLKSELIRSYNVNDEDSEAIDYGTVLDVFNQNMAYVFDGLQ